MFRPIFKLSCGWLVPWGFNKNNFTQHVIEDPID